MVSYDLFTKACQHYDQHDFEEALDIFIRAANSGDHDAMSRIALMYANGEGVDINLNESIRWDRLAIQSGSIVSIGNLALTLLSLGETSEAKGLLEKAIQYGDGDAAVDLAKVCIDENDLTKAVNVLNQAIFTESICDESLAEAHQLLARSKGSE